MTARLLTLLAAVVAFAANGSAQQEPLQPDPASAQIHATLRAFYFNLAHQDWEALTADILPAKVVAHRPAPWDLLIAARTTAASGRFAGTSLVRNDSLACPSTAAAMVERAEITFEGDWAEVAVPRCGNAAAGTDEFRLILFEARWRIVYIELFSQLSM
jgi:hypothetical protein